MSQGFRRQIRHDSSPLSSESDSPWSPHQLAIQNRHQQQIRHIDGTNFSQFPLQCNEHKLEFDKEWPKILQIVDSIVNEKEVVGYATASSIISELTEDSHNIPKITSYVRELLIKPTKKLIESIESANDITEVANIIKVCAKKHVLISSIFQQWEKIENITISSIIYTLLKSEISTNPSILDHVLLIVSQAFTKSRQDEKLYRQEIKRSVHYFSQIDRLSSLTDSIAKEVTSYYQCHPIDPQLGPFLFILSLIHI